MRLDEQICCFLVLLNCVTYCHAFKALEVVKRRTEMIILCAIKKISNQLSNCNILSLIIVSRD